MQKRLDIFLRDFLGKTYPELWACCQKLLILSHGPGTVSTSIKREGRRSRKGKAEEDHLEELTRGFKEKLAELEIIEKEIVAKGAELRK
ncbi:hypothetical protein KUCAC02_037709 [Chaenocephalus aceratus]|nr:hypothetical protein KUCAC02_037709 [Chaenocephalus aceratus]